MTFKANIAMACFALILSKITGQLNQVALTETLHYNLVKFVASGRSTVFKLNSR